MNVGDIIRTSETGETVVNYTEAERASIAEIVASGYSEDQARDVVLRARADVEAVEAETRRVPWFAVAEALRAYRNTRRVARLEKQTFVTGPYYTSRAMRRAEGERGHRHGFGALAPSLPTRRSK